MLTRLRIRRLKRFHDADIELGNPVVFIGPNDSGKTTALQALALWELGVKRWNEKRKGKEAPKKRSGVTINRRDLLALPLSESKLLWKNLRVRDVRRVNDKQQTQNILIEIVVDGNSGGEEWSCGLEFDYANQESFYCRPFDGSDGERMPVPDEAAEVHLAFLPPMSGLASTETRLDRGAIDVRIGEGRTAEVLRNLCHLIHTNSDPSGWKQLCDQMEKLFGVRLIEPVYVSERGEVEMSYRTHKEIQLDLSASGRGMQQTLLLFAHLIANPGAVLLLDEPDAHLEILRQRQIYEELVDVARDSGGQVIAASHSEVILEEAARSHTVIAFLGNPHRIDNGSSQVRKSLSRIGWNQFAQAEQRGWVLYLEGATDLRILKRLAQKLGHPAQEHLESPFTHYIGNSPKAAHDHFYGLCEAKSDLVGVALFDHLDHKLEEKPGLTQAQWKRREIENYLCSKDILLRWAKEEAHPDNLFEQDWEDVMAAEMQKLEDALVTTGKGSPWSDDFKISDDFLTPLFQNFFAIARLPNEMRKSNFHRLVDRMRPDEIDAEVNEKLDMICEVAGRAHAPGLPGDDEEAVE